MDHPVHKPRERKQHTLLILSAVFVGILFFLIYTSFYNPGFKKSITGNIIKGSSSGGTIEIEATLLSPDELEIDGDVGKIELRIFGGNFFVGRERFELGKASIIIDDFEGEISFNGDNVSRLDGQASKVFVEGIPITSESDMKVYFNEGFKYNFLKLNDFYLDSLSYQTSGIVKLNGGKVMVDLDDEEFRIKKFQGDLSLKKDKVKLNGVVSESNLGFIDIKAVPRKEKVEEVEEAEDDA